MQGLRSGPGLEAAPPLESGDHLERAEFERRYAARGDDLKCELIGGVVFVASPVRQPHSHHTALLAYWLGAYAERTPGVQVLLDPSLPLGPRDVPQPDLAARLEQGGRSTIDAEGYVAGPVELVVEVAHSSVANDLHGKKACYARHGCAEYLVVLVDEQEARWFAHDGAGYAPVAPDADGTLASRVLPGLRLDPRALFAGDRRALIAALGR
ncbi:MAG: Uma2 family endonuclease [Planctomycetes bacterium]|nr:Uma2 family endonuclease [Planctomycetota bacterium]